MIDKCSDRKVFIIFFGFCLITGLLVQTFVLPVLLPRIHDGFGLILGSDSSVSTRLLCERANVGGWGDWSRVRLGRPLENLILLVYLLVGCFPIYLVPFQSLFYAGGLFILFKYAEAVSKNRTLSFVAVLPFFIFPTAIFNYTQLQKDSIDLLGFTCITLFPYFFMRNLDARSKTFLICVVGIILGLWINAISKPYFTKLMILYLIVAFTILCIEKYRWTLKSCIFILFTIFLIGLYSKVLPQKDDPARTYYGKEKSEISNINPTPNPLVKEPEWHWEKSNLPSTLDDLFKNLSKARVGYLTEASWASTSIDTDVVFENWKQVVAYIPRAFQIAFFTPFPNQWFKSSDHPTSPLFRLMGAIETIVFYPLFPFFFYFVYQNRKNHFLLLFVGFCFLTTIMQSLTIINIGTLHRHRFTVRTLFMGLGFIGLSVYLKKRKEPVPNLSQQREG